MLLKPPTKIYYCSECRKMFSRNEGIIQDDTVVNKIVVKTVFTCNPRAIKYHKIVRIKVS